MGLVLSRMRKEPTCCGDQVRGAELWALRTRRGPTRHASPPAATCLAMCLEHVARLCAANLAVEPVRAVKLRWQPALRRRLALADFPALRSTKAAKGTGRRRERQRAGLRLRRALS